MDAAGPGGGPPDAAQQQGQPGGGLGPILAALVRGRGGAQATNPGAGAQAAALQQVKMALEMLQGALPQLDMGTDVHRDVAQVVVRLSRHLPSGIPSPQAQQLSMQDMMRNTQRNGMLQRIMASQGQGGGGQPQPSTPYPGA